MLENISLDTEGFEEIFRKARSQISEVYPKWNDYNYHDPGITLLELFAFLKEAEQFYMDHVSEDVIRGFLKLLGVVQNAVVPAMIEVDFEKTYSLYRGEKFYVNEICFEAEESCEILKNNIQCIITDKVYPYSDEHFRVYPFSEKPEEGKECYIGMETGLKQGQMHKLRVVLEENKDRKRNPIIHFETFTRLAEIEIFYWNGTEFKKSDIIDKTVDFLQNGEILLRIEEPMHQTVISGIEGYFLKVVLKKCAYDIPPLITELSFSKIELHQRKTVAQWLSIEEKDKIYQESKCFDYYSYKEPYYQLSDELSADYMAVYEEEFYADKILGMGNGFPSQKYHFNTDIIDSSRMEILCKSVLYDGKYAKFTQVNDFGASLPDSWHYVVDEEKGEISFGDGVRGICPENEIVIVGLAFCKGKDGNIATGNEVKSVDFWKKGSVCDLLRNGLYPESMELAALRTDSDEITRMVSAKDYETVIKQTEGLLIQDCKVLEDDTQEGNIVKVVVKPAYRAASLSDIYKKNIIRYTDDKRLLGTTIQLQSPTYTIVEIFIEVVVNPEFLQAKEVVIQTIESYFASLDGFGKITEYNVLYRKVNSLKEVSAIHSLSIGARGDGITRSRTGDVITPETSVTILEHINCNVVS